MASLRLTAVALLATVILQAARVGFVPTGQPRTRPGRIVTLRPRRFARLPSRATALVDGSAVNPALAADGKELRTAWQSWITATFFAHVVALVAILLARRLQRRTFWGWWWSPAAWAAGLASGIAVLLVNRRRLNLKRLSSASFEMLLYAMFDERTASFFARLPEAVKELQKQVGAMQESSFGDLDQAEMSKAKALRRLYDLSASGTREPYSEARDAYHGEAAKVPDLQEAVQFLAFAEATYEDRDILQRTCQKYGHEVIFLEATSMPGAPAHFLSFDKRNKEAILSIRGTKTLSDVLTDLVQDIDEFELEDGQKAYAHAGFLASARHVLWRVSPIVRDLLTPQGYSLSITGHSLGAGTAALVTRMLMKESCGWEIPPRSIRCLCFAPPPVIDRRQALASDNITSYVCNDDCVPRISLQNIGRLNLLAQGKEVQEVLNLGAQRQEVQEPASEKLPELLVPGKVIMLHQLKADASKSPGEWAAWAADGTMPELNYMELAPASVAQHMAPVYREAIVSILAAKGANNDVSPRAQEDYPTWLKRATPA